MDHSSAIKNLTAERYMLGELNELEQDAYEEHFFSCPACAAEVKGVSDFMESAKRAIITEKQAETRVHFTKQDSRGNWLNWQRLAPLAACLLLAGFIGYQNIVTIPSLARGGGASKPQTSLAAQLAPKMLILGESRDAAKSLAISKDQGLILQFDITDTSFDNYQAEIIDSSNAVRILTLIPKEEIADPVRVPVSAGRLESGKYSVVIRGAKNHSTESKELSQLSFQLNIQD